MANTLRSATVLVIEDEPLIGLDIENILVAHGASVTCAETLERARQAIARERPDAAILDVLLPDGNSLLLARQLAAGGTAIVFVTGYSPGVAADLEIWPIVEKPFTPEALVAALLQAIETRNGRA